MVPLTGALIYFMLIAIFLLVIKATKYGYDARPQGTPDVFYDHASKWHAIGCFFACLGAMWLLHVSWGWALGLTILGGIAYEAVNGYFSWTDCVWDTIGAGVASFFHPDQEWEQTFTHATKVLFWWTVIAVVVCLLISWLLKGQIIRFIDRRRAKV